jgi:DNA helicase-2/ATP-dependent DNA helicase PcrA
MAYKINYKNELNEKQYEAVMHHEGPCLVIAGAGTGKTRMLVYRVARLIEDGIRPESILCLTFTRKAAENMKLKCSGMLDKRCELVTASTFHGFALSVLKRYAVYTGYGKDFDVIDQQDAEKILDLVKEKEEFQIMAHSIKFPNGKHLISIISKAATKQMPIPAVIEAYYPKYEKFTAMIEFVAAESQKFKKAQNKMDFDDLLKNFKDLMLKNEFIRHEIQQKYKFIMIDEYQDTDRLQAEIAMLLAGDNGNLMVVGDDAQSIYAFRGADFRNIMSFPDLFEKVQKITIEQNYRSTQEILNLGNAVMTNANERYEKNLFTSKLGTHKPLLIRTLDNHRESILIAELIEYNKEYQNYGLNNIAVLFRNGNYSYALEVELNKRGVPFKKYGGIGFGQKAHIKDVVAFLKIGINNEDTLGWLRVLKLYRGIGDKKAKKIINQIIQEKKGLEYLRTIGLNDLYHLFLALSIDRSGPGEKLNRIAEFYHPFFDTVYPHKKNQWADIETLKRIASNHFSSADFLNSVVMNSFEDDNGNNKEFITLSTIHSAKGLEWDAVYIICANDGCIPHSPERKSSEEMDEEVRLMHVAITRAKNHLYLVAPRNQSHEGATGNISRFLTDEIVSDCLEVADYSI